MHAIACNFRWAKNITILGWPTQSYCNRTLSEPQCVMKVKNCQIREHCAIAMPVILGGPRILHYRMKLAFFSQI
jgi:hypothetical protein